MPQSGQVLATGYVRIVPSMKGVGKAIISAFDTSSTQAGLRGGHKAASGLGRGLAAKAGAIAGAVSSVASKAVGVLASSVGGAVKRADVMANFPKIMKNFGATTRDSDAAIKQMSNHLDGLPTSLPALAGMVQQLMPVTHGIREATGVAEAFNDALLAGGSSAIAQENAMEQWTQMLAAGKPDMAAWRSVVNAMPGQMNQLAKSILGPTKNQTDLYNAVKKGTVSFNDLNKAFIRLDQQGGKGFASFAQQAKDATKGIGTAVQNLSSRT